MSGDQISYVSTYFKLGDVTLEMKFHVTSTSTE